MDANRKHRKLLVIDDAPIDREIYARCFKRDPHYEYEILEAETGEQGLELLATDEFDCVVLDYNLPDLDGLDILDELRANSTIEVPVVMLTGAGSEAIAVETMKRGCQDYVVKNDASADGLLRAVENAIEKVRLRREIERNRVELETSQREQIELKNRFLSHVSHELRTPLTAVHQFLSLCLDGLAGELTDTQTEYLGIAQRNADQLKKMIGDLMEVTRAESGKLRFEVAPLPVAGLVEESVQTSNSAAAAKDITLDSRVESGLPDALADDSRIRQVLGNLIENAIKFTPPGGSIVVSACQEPSDSTLVRVSVTDTGCGISAEACEQIFNRLHQEQFDTEEARNGLGLGLAICKELISLQGGHIWVESTEGAGSTFHFTLPLFSLPKIIAPALLIEDCLRVEYGLLRIRFSGEGPGGVATDHASLSLGASRRIHHLIRRLVYYPQDVVVPRFWDARNLDTHFVVAATDGEGLKAMGSRIRNHLRTNIDTIAPGYRVRVDSSTRSTEHADGGAVIDLEACIETAARDIEAMIRNPKRWGD